MKRVYKSIITIVFVGLLVSLFSFSVAQAEGVGTVTQRPIDEMLYYGFSSSNLIFACFCVTLDYIIKK